MKKFKQHLLPIILVLCGILDQTTDILPTLLSQLNAPVWAATVIKIIVITLGAIKLYLSIPNNLNNGLSKPQ